MTRKPSPPPVTLLRVDLPADSGWSALAWSSFDATGKWVAHGEAAPEALPAHGKLEIVLPARRVSAHSVSLPAQEKKHLAALIAQAMEDRLLGDKADALYVAGAQTGTERTIWVCSRRWLDEQLLRLTTAGLSADRIFPEYELLPLIHDATSCALTADGTIFRRSDGCVGLADTLATVGLLTGQQDVRLCPDRMLLPSPLRCTNMLSGRPSGVGRLAFDPRRLSRSAILLALSASLLLFGHVLHWRQLENQQERLQHEIRQTFATRFPGTKIIDPALQWESKMRELAPLANGDALDALLMLAAQVNSPLHPRRIEARDGLIDITLSNAEAAQFKTQLDGAGGTQSSPAEPGLTRLQFRVSR